MPDTNLAPPCGLYCGTCEHLGEKCRGCGHQGGKPFWTAMAKVENCPLYDCCQNRKQLEHCGLCDDFPCETFNSLRDPSLSDEAAEESLRERQKDLTLRKEVGTETWLEEKK